MNRDGIYVFTSRALRVLLLGAAVLLVALNAFGQQAILGVVTDESGAVVS